MRQRKSRTAALEAQIWELKRLADHSLNWVKSLEQENAVLDLRKYRHEVTILYGPMNEIQRLAESVS